MADLKISQLPEADALTGDELVPVVQDGSTVQTTAQAVANLANGMVLLANSGGGPQVLGSLNVYVGLADLPVLQDGLHVFRLNAVFELSVTSQSTVRFGFVSDNLGADVATITWPNYNNTGGNLFTLTAVVTYDSVSGLITGGVTAINGTAASDNAVRSGLSGTLLTNPVLGFCLETTTSDAEITIHLVTADYVGRG
jgi:hypothetical protein